MTRSTPATLQRGRHARPAGDLPRDGPRSGRGLRDRRRPPGRDRAERSTRGREAAERPRVLRRSTPARSRRRELREDDAPRSSSSFNWFYADDKDIALFSSGRLPVRAPGTDPALPTDRHRAPTTGAASSRRPAPAGDQPGPGVILNWNNKPAPGCRARPTTTGRTGPIQRVAAAPAARSTPGSGKLTLADVVSAMNRAATQDLRAWRCCPTIARSWRAVRRRPRARRRCCRAPRGLARRRAEPARRRPRRQDRRSGRGDHGRRVAAGRGRGDDARCSARRSPTGSRRSTSAATTRTPAARRTSTAGTATSTRTCASLLGQPVKGAYSTRYCGDGDLAACRASLWAALDAAGAELAAAQGADPAAWRADATAERIRFTSGILSTRCAGRTGPTFQQVVTFTGHRPR